MDTKYIIGFIIAIIVILGGVVIINNKTQAPVSNIDLSSLVQCLKEKKVTFYGAFWCPHCQATKRMFGSSAKNLPYVECSTADGNSQTQICKDKGISSYPTWEFADGLRLTGERGVSDLAQASGCPIPPGAEGLTPSGTIAPASSAATSGATTSTATSTQ